MTATKPVPLYLVDDDDKTVLAPPPTFLEEDAVTKVSLQRMRSVPPPIVVPTGDEPTRILEAPVRPIVERSGALAAAPNEVSTLVTRGRSPLRFAMVALALVIAGLLGTLWRRAHTPAPQHAAATTPATAASTPAKPPTPVAKIELPIPEPTAPTPSATPATVATTTSAAGAPTPPSSEERAAVEAVASGSYAHAAKLYQALADAHPSNDAYRVAARILLDRSKESAR